MLYKKEIIKRMLSKRNYQERLRQMEQKTERFSIRKLTIGAASV